MSNDRRGWSKEPLSEEELQNVRYVLDRFPEHDESLGPFVYVMGKWKHFLAVLVVVAFLGSDQGRAIIGLISDALQ
jgi:hypothetical protein